MSATTIDHTDYEAAAREYANNHAQFDSFAWFAEPEDGENWALVYTSNRDADTITRANAEAIEAALSKYIGRTVRAETHNHWAVGYVEGYAIRVYTKRGKITAAFKLWCDLQARIDDYPLLDESIHSRLECEEQEQSWDNWARSEFVRELQKALEVEIDDSDSAKIAESFETLRDRANVYWEDGSIDIARIVEAATCDDVRELIAPVCLQVYRDGFPFVTGTITGDEYACDLPLYEDEFGAVIVARDNGAESLDFGGHIFTWQES
jgi:hypothetical protein